jgi:cation diffusion facilitator family transporter
MHKIAHTPTKDVVKVTLIGLIVNIFLTFFKYLAGVLGRSSAMIADATHSLSDLISDIIVLVFVRIAARPVDEDHRYGHGKFETFSTFAVGILLAVAGFGILWGAGHNIYNFSKGQIVEPPDSIALAAAFGSIIVKELLFWYTIIAARRNNSQVLRANAWHHRSDALSSVATLLGIGGAILLGGKWQVLDPIAAGLVSFMILRVAWKITMPAVNDLLEKSLPPETSKEICSIISSVEHVQHPHGLRTRRIGNNIAIEMHIKIDPSMSVYDSHEVTLVVEKKLKEKYGDDTHVVIHVDPA